MENERFQPVGCDSPVAAQPSVQAVQRKTLHIPYFSAAVLAVIVLGCLFCDLFIPCDPAYMDLYHANQAPCAAYWFGTDAMGRDIFSMIWYGGRLSLLIGMLSSLLSTAIAVCYGTASALSPAWLDGLMTRLLEIFLSIPNLLLMILIQAALGKASVLRISLVLGVASWMSIAKVVRSEVLRLRESGFIVAARCMGAGFAHNLWKHFLPNLFPTIMFMIVMNVRGAILSESTLSFLGIGLPLEIITWGSMLSLSERSLLSGAWWTVLIPGLFLIVTLLSLTRCASR